MVNVLVCHGFSASYSFLIYFNWLLSKSMLDCWVF